MKLTFFLLLACALIAVGCTSDAKSVAEKNREAREQVTAAEHIVQKERQEARKETFAVRTEENQAIEEQKIEGQKIEGTVEIAEAERKVDEAKIEETKSMVDSVNRDTVNQDRVNQDSANAARESTGTYRQE